MDLYGQLELENDGANESIVVSNFDKSNTYCFIFRTHKIDRNSNENKIKELNDAKTKYNTQLNYNKPILSNDKKEEIENRYNDDIQEINDRYDKKEHEYSRLVNNIKKLKIIQANGNKRKKEFYIKKGLRFEKMENSKKRRCIAEEIYDYDLASKKENNTQPMVKIKYLNNKRPGKCRWDELTPYGHGINK